MEKRKGIRELTDEEIQQVAGGIPIAAPLLLTPVSQLSIWVNIGGGLAGFLGGFTAGHTFNKQLNSYGYGFGGGGI